MSKINYCANCEHWFCYDELDADRYVDTAEGECRRYPPSVPIFEGRFNEEKNVQDLIINLKKGTPFMNHPFTFASTWCGEFKLMDNPRWKEEIVKELGYE